MDYSHECAMCGERNYTDGPCLVCGQWRCPRCGKPLYDGAGGIDTLWCSECRINFRLRLVDETGQQWRAYRGPRRG